MSKLDTSCGLTAQQIGTIKFAIKRALGLKLPILPEHVDMKLFFEGREAWTYSWRLREQDALNPLHPMSVEVDVKLKKEFCQYQLCTRHMFLCQLQLQPDIYSPIRSIRKKAPKPAVDRNLVKNRAARLLPR
jgi:hypothetical protein